MVGSRQVRVEDRKDLPFTDAVIHESQRLCNIGPMAIPHKTSQDVTFEGYFIEKVNLECRLLCNGIGVAREAALINENRLFHVKVLT